MLNLLCKSRAHLKTLSVDLHTQSPHMPRQLVPLFETARCQMSQLHSCQFDAGEAARHETPTFVWKSASTLFGSRPCIPAYPLVILAIMRNRLQQGAAQDKH
jgi:hypothetical protein